ncbi:LytTR family DNA-binding domain-containing protein [uncultured Lutibacter sp.]|uniref:LytR/AlgR family response regulator transcription factor n=1 Tax=uncultured Lutibacter sp. TaxID=437739 RepID=UPI0026083775|nr:LytTR family DNA-binding domain-containing protein [uncultured Lutibacter sp.]
MNLKTLIIDDEALARLRLKNLIDEIPQLDLLGECENGQEAIDSINNLVPDLIFLDIEMKDFNGFDVLKKIDKNIKPAVIFVTAYNKYALKAFDFFAFDYLLKPYKDERFFKSVQNVLQYYGNKEYEPFVEKIEDLIKYIKNTNSITDFSDRIPIKVGNKFKLLNSEDIKYISASGYYAEIFLKEKKYLLRESLSNLILILNPQKFSRIHRSTIINLNDVVELVKSNYGEIDVRMSDSKLFRISKSYKKEVLKKLNIVN